MKKLFRHIFTISLLLFAGQLFAQKEDKKRYDNFRERNISKTYTASGNTLKIDNSFGDVTVTTWDKNEIKVDVHIEASATDKEHAESLFNAIEVTEKQNGKTISFKTNVESNDKKSNCKNCSSSMEINYTIQMPASNALSIENSFGSINVPDYSGPISLTSKFGSLTTGVLSKTEDIAVEFGSAKIKSTGNIDAVFKFSTITIDKLSGSNKIKIEFCGNSKIAVDNSLTALTLNESYSTVNLKTSPDFSATYSVKTSFGSVKDRSNANLKRTDEPDEYGPDSDKNYEGRSGSGSAKVDIKSSFGTIIIGEATADDMKDKNKEKKKKTTEA
ncbi:MAG: hypothetical protein QM791_07110 [Ferruginibacter sp.]